MDSYKQQHNDYIVHGKYPFQFESAELRDVYFSRLEQIYKEIESRSCRLMEREFNVRDLASYLGPEITNVEVSVSRSPRVYASSIVRDNAVVISISCGLISYFASMNSLMLRMADRNEFGTHTHELVSSATNIAIFHITSPRSEVSYNVLGHEAPSGVFKEFLSKNSYYDSGLELALDHQLEFVLLHEIYHAIHPIKDNASDEQKLASEIAADVFAAKRVFRDWDDCDTYHTSFCEAAIFSIFLFYEFLDFFRSSGRKMINRLTSWADIPLPKKRITHPSNINRYTSTVQQYNKSISHFGAHLIKCFELMLDATKINIVTCGIDLTRLMQLFRITALERIEHVMEITNPESMEVMGKPTMTTRDSQDVVEPGRGISPSVFFEEIDPEKKYSVNELVALQERSVGIFADAISSTIGEISTEVIAKEAGRLFVVAGSIKGLPTIE